MTKILVIDDDIHVGETLSSLMERLGHECLIAHTVADGLAIVEAHPIDVVFLDIRLPDGNGLNSLPLIKNRSNAPEVIILTGQGDPDGAELAIQGGAWDFLVKPTPIKQTTLTLKRALQYREEKLHKAANARVLNLENVVGASSAMHTCFNLLAQAASSDANVLITGETGTGKELMARTIHENSHRTDNNFVVVDCASLTKSLVSSTLFGHRKGAFTGAQADKDGLVKLADKGTLFLDEVGEMPLSIQKSFLRFLQERVFRPVGDTKEIRSNFRLLSATNRDLDAMVEKGRFRKDLLFRLKTMHVGLPPLRQREADLKPLGTFHVQRLCEQYNTPPKEFSTDFFSMLTRYTWPGNIREFFNVLERAFVASGMESIIYPMHLPQDLRITLAKASLADGGIDENSPHSALNQPALSGKSDGNDFFWDPNVQLPELKEFKQLMEKQYLKLLIKQAKGNVQQTLEISGLSRSHFYALLKKNHMSL